MEGITEKYIRRQIGEAQRIMSAMLADEAIISTLEEAAEACINAMRTGRKVLLAGNGGSAADAQHIAGEFAAEHQFATQDSTALVS
jgi:D-sedoheptulose 7-phosphate isomerase